MIDVLNTFLGNNGEPEKQNQQGFTCLHIAAREGHTEIVKMLVARQVNQDIRDKFGYTASYWAL